MTCRELVEFLTDYVEGELDEHTRGRFDQHLAACPDCIHFLSRYRETMRASYGAYAGDVPSDVPDDLVRAILVARNTLSK